MRSKLPFTHPKIRYYDQDFVDVYNIAWNRLHKKHKIISTEKLKKSFLYDPEYTQIHQSHAIFSSFYLVYLDSNGFSATSLLDNFYALQDSSGAIFDCYDLQANPVFSKDHPSGLGMPLFSWAEVNIYKKLGSYKRLKTVLKYLDKYYNWIKKNFQDPQTNLYHGPLQTGGLPLQARKKAHYPIDFNALQAINILYMANIADILNNRTLAFHYKKDYFILKTAINKWMWHEESNLYYDLDKSHKLIMVKSVACFLPLLAQVPNNDMADAMIAHLSNKSEFYSMNPFPTLSMDHPDFDPGQQYTGWVDPIWNFLIIKGLEKYNYYGLAKEFCLIHMYFILETFWEDQEKNQNSFYRAYHPSIKQAATIDGQAAPSDHFFSIGLVLFTMMIENIVGLHVSFAQKTVEWITDGLEVMGIENLCLRKNNISISIVRNSQHWEVRLSSEKLYYFRISIDGHTTKNYPIPAGQCSLLIDKILH